MSSAAEHYENLLAEYYSWLFGDFDARVESIRKFFEGRGIARQKKGKAVDLGAGPGFQSIALAELGFEVIAVDASRKLLNELKSKSRTLPITTVCDDMLNFAAHCSGPLEVCVCMGDTLPHLESFEKAAALFDRVYSSLVEGGRFVITFRDLTLELKGPDRFIPVRSDANTIFTCFLEYEPDHVQVHDLVYTKNHDAWTLRKSSYRKLRIAFDWALEGLKKTGFVIESNDNDKGMITIVAQKRTG